MLLALHVDLASFKIGGGLILLQFGFSMMKGTAVNVESMGDGTSENLRKRVLQRYQQIFIPIGVPVIAGPGAITTVIIYGHQSDTTLTTVFLSLTMMGVLAVLFFTLLTGAFIKKMIGILPLDLTSRVFGMILIAISVQFMVEGLMKTFPGWLE
jgi:multiple antibiotic resistance protein